MSYTGNGADQHRAFEVEVAWLHPTLKSHVLAKRILPVPEEREVA